MWHEALCLFAQLRCASNPSCRNRVAPLPACPLIPLCAVSARNLAEPLQLRYANNSNYKNDTMIRKECYVSQAVLDELRRIIEDAEVGAGGAGACCRLLTALRVSQPHGCARCDYGSSSLTAGLHAHAVLPVRLVPAACPADF